MGFLPISAAASICLFKPPYTIGSVPSLPGHAIAYRWRSLPRVHLHRASKPHGSSKREPPWQVTMDQLINASLSHTHYWYEVVMLKVYRTTVWRMSGLTGTGRLNLSRGNKFVGANGEGRENSNIFTVHRSY